MVKDLRDRSGAGVMDAKRALDEADGDMERAAALLRERGLAAAASRAERETSQGVVDTYIHAGGRIGALVEVNCETDFVAKTDEFRTLVHEVAMQVAEQPDIGISGEGDILLDQPLARDSSKTAGELVQDAMAKTGENIRIRRFARFDLPVDGVVDTYIHAGGRIGALVEVNCETDFVAKTDEFRTLVHEVAMQVAAMDPAVVAPDDRAGRPELEGADEEVALLSQPWVKDGSRTVGDLVRDAMAKTGENIRVRRFARFELGG